jgi:hypothetical protein
MTLTDTTTSDGNCLEECLDDFTDLIVLLQRYPLTTLAVALRVHLEALLQALLQKQVCSRAEVREFVRELERSALEFEQD